jgi:hypothetical protein
MRGQVRTTAAWPGPGNGRGNPWAVRLNSGDCCRGCCSWPCTRPSSRQACRRAGWLSTSEAEEAAQKEVKEQQTSHTMVPSPSSSCQVQTNPTGSADDLLARPDIKAGKRSLAHSERYGVPASGTQGDWGVPPQAAGTSDRRKHQQRLRTVTQVDGGQVLSEPFPTALRGGR